MELKKMEWKLRSTKPEMLVYYFAKLIGLAPFAMIKKERWFRPPTLVDMVYSVFLIAGYSYMLLMGLPVVIERLCNVNTTMIPKLIGFFAIAVDIPLTFFVLGAFLLANKKIVDIMNKFHDIGNELKSLGIVENLRKLFTNICVTTVIANVILIIIYNILMFIRYRVSIFSLCKYFIESFIRFNTILIFSQTLLFVKQRFALLNEHLYKVFGPQERLRSLCHTRIFPIRQNQRREELIEENILRFSDRRHIHEIDNLHFQLNHLVCQISNLFTLPILLTSLQSLVELMTHCFYIYYNIVHFNDDIGRQMPVINSIVVLPLTMVITSLQLFVLSYASDTTCKEGNTTKIILTKVWFKFKPQHLRDEFYNFGNNLQENAIVVSIFGFFNLNYSYLYNILCTVIAYLIIIIQFDTS